MKRLLTFAATVAITASALCADFGSHFDNTTLRINASITGRGDAMTLTLDSIAAWNGWYGRRANLTRLQYPEEIQVSVIDATTADTIYVDAKSPEAFEEEEEPGKALHVSLFVPKPRREARLEVTIFGYDSVGRKALQTSTIALTPEKLASLKSDRRGAVTPYCILRQAANRDSCIHFAFVAEGYTQADMSKFICRAALLDSILFTQPAFRDHADLFNVVAVMLPSEQSGITIPSQGVNINTALGAHFDSFGLERLVTIPDTWVMWDVLEGVPASQVLILANTEKYGGSGSYNEYAIASADNRNFPEIITHELGHSFAWLGDEYESGYSISYTPDVEPLEPNITTLHDFSKKWQNLIDSGEASLIEGAGYQEKGVWRGCEHCLMRSLADKVFCPVCNQAISKTIGYFTAEQ